MPPSFANAFGPPRRRPRPPASNTPSVRAMKSLVARPLVDQVLEWPAAPERVEVAREQIDRALPETWTEPRHVRGEHHLRHVPKPALGRKRLIVEDVEGRAGET